MHQITYSTVSSREYVTVKFHLRETSIIFCDLPSMSCQGHLDELYRYRIRLSVFCGAVTTLTHDYNKLIICFKPVNKDLHEL